jgi:uncharacterized protein (DUF305 family)
MFRSFATIVASIAMLCAGPNDSPDTIFVAQVNVAMMKMMNGMNVRPSGDVDKDFVDMMISHHEGAIYMAEAQLRYGHNARLHRISQEIIVTQQQEIVAMRLAIGEKISTP